MTPQVAKERGQEPLIWPNPPVHLHSLHCPLHTTALCSHSPPPAPGQGARRRAGAGGEHCVLLPPFRSRLPPSPLTNNSSARTQAFDTMAWPASCLLPSTSCLLLPPALCPLPTSCFLHPASCLLLPGHWGRKLSESMFSPYFSPYPPPLEASRHHCTQLHCTVLNYTALDCTAQY